MNEFDFEDDAEVIAKPKAPHGNPEDTEVYVPDIALDEEETAGHGQASGARGVVGGQAQAARAVKQGLGKMFGRNDVEGSHNHETLSPPSRESEQDQMSSTSELQSLTSLDR